MAITTSMFWTPNTTEAVAHLRENLLGFREAARSAGWTCDVLGLVPGGGGIPGEMGLAIQYSSNEEYAAAIDGEPPAEIVAFQQGMKSSDARPDRTVTLIEVEGTEIPYDDLPKGLVQASIIAPHPGKAPHAIADMRKSQEIMARLGIKARVMQAFLSNPWGNFAYLQYFDSAAAWLNAANALGSDDEWQAHFARASDNRQIVRMSMFAIES